MQAFSAAVTATLAATRRRPDPGDDSGVTLGLLCAYAEWQPNTGAVAQGSFSLVWSAILDLENTANPDAERREAIQGWQSLAAIDIEATTEVERLAGELTKQGLKPMDALHVASAIKAEATWFLTTDNGLLRKLKGENRLAVVDPVDFIRSLQE